MNTSELITTIIIFFIPLIFIIKYKEKFIYGYLVFNFLIDILTGFINIETVSIAISRAMISLIFLFVVYLNSHKKLFYGNRIFLIYFVFLALLLPFSSQFLISFSSYLKVVITLSMFPIGIYLIRTEYTMYKLNKTILWFLFLFTLNFLVSNYFQIGKSAYSTDVEFYAGNLQLSALNTATWCLIILPVIFYLKYPNYVKRTALIISIPSIIFLILSLKRTSLVALGIGLLIIFILSETKSRFIKPLLITFSLLFIVSPLYMDILQRQIEARESRLRLEIIENEFRYLEFFYVLDEIINADNSTITLFGKEIFNTVGNYAGGLFGIRVIHNDFSLLLFSSGIIGIIIYILIYVNIFNLFYKTIRNISKRHIAYQLYKIFIPVFFALFICSIIVSFSGGMLGITHRTILFFYLGAIIGLLKKKLKQEFKNI